MKTKIKIEIKIKDMNKTNTTTQHFSNKLLGTKEKNVILNTANAYHNCLFNFDNAELSQKLNDYQKSMLAQLNADQELSIYLNNISLLVISLQCELADSQNLVSSLLNNYPVYSLYKIFEMYAYIKPERIPAQLYVDRDIMQMQSFEGFPAIDIEQLLYADTHLNAKKRRNRSWVNIEGLLKHGKKFYMAPVDYDSPSIDTNCINLFGKTQLEMAAMLGENSSLFMGIKFLLSDKLKHDFASIKALLSISTYFAARTLIELYPQMESKQLRKFLALPQSDQVQYLISTLQENPKISETLKDEHLNSLTETHNALLKQGKSSKLRH